MGVRHYAWSDASTRAGRAQVAAPLDALKSYLLLDLAQSDSICLDSETSSVQDTETRTMRTVRVGLTARTESDSCLRVTLPAAVEQRSECRYSVENSEAI